MASHHKFFFGLGLFVLSSASAQPGAATKLASVQDPCGVKFQFRTPGARALTLDDPFLQTLKWEQRSNHWRFVQPSVPVSVKVVGVDSSLVAIQQVDKLDPNLAAMFNLSGPVISWPQHPLATDPNIPFLSNTNVVGDFNMAYTASRSGAFILGGRIYTIKMPTDRPHANPLSRSQPLKANLRNDLLVAIARSKHIQQVEERYGADSRLMLSRDVLAVSDRQTGSGGFIVRDANYLQDGHYYFPASAIPFEGQRIADLNGVRPAQFWLESYAKPLGRMKAILLLRYGVEMEALSPQNALLQLDVNLRPTGRVVIRDLSDSFFVSGIGEALGYQEEMLRDDAREYPPRRLAIEWGWSTFRLSQSRYLNARNPIDRITNEWWLLFDDRTLDRWGHAHARAFVEEIESSLGITISYPGRNATDGAVDWRAMEDAVHQAVTSEQGRSALRSFQNRLETQARGSRSSEP